MKCGELIEYLKRFDPDEQVSAVVVDPDKRIYHKVSGYQLIDEMAAMLFEVKETGPLDDIVEDDETFKEGDN